MSGGWADIAAANAKLLTQAIEKLTAAERELELLRPVVDVALAWEVDELRSEQAENALALVVQEIRIQRQRDAAGRGEP